MFPKDPCLSKEMKQADTRSQNLYYLVIAFYLCTDFLSNTTVLILLKYLYDLCDFSIRLLINSNEPLC